MLCSSPFLFCFPLSSMHLCSSCLSKFVQPLVMKVSFRGSSAAYHFWLIHHLTTLTQAASSAPFEATWSSATFGPDGPWQAVEVNVGENSKVALYPGHTFQSLVISTDYCKLNSSNGCYASKAGTYNRAQAFQDGTGSASGIQYKPPLHEWMAGMDVRGTLPTSWVDSIALKSAATSGRHIRSRMSV